MNGAGNDVTIALFAGDGKLELISELASSGQRVIELPVPRFVPAVDATLPSIEEVDWVVFTGTEPARAFCGLDSAFRELEESADAIRVAAIGKRTSEILRDRMIHSDVVSDESRPDAIVSDLRAYDSGLRGVTALIVGGDWDARPIASSFAAAGAEASAIIACTVCFDDSAAVSRIRTLALGGAIDRILVDSPEEVEMLSVLFAGGSIDTLFPETDFFCADVPTALRIREIGIPSALIRIRTKKDGHGEP